MNLPTFKLCCLRNAFGTTSVFDRMFIRFLLQKIQSSEEELLLRSVDLDTTGLYRCEISGEAPLFQTASREAVLAVVGKIFSRFLKNFISGWIKVLV